MPLLSLGRELEIDCLTVPEYRHCQRRYYNGTNQEYSEHKLLGISMI